MKRALFSLVVAGGLAAAYPAAAQDNYEIQVYGAETVAPSTTMVELHTNYTGRGDDEAANGLRPTTGTWHETLEITQGVTPWFETGFYVFTSVSTAFGWQWVGDHIRPRIRVPEDWHWPVGLSLSMEVGYTRAPYTGDTWTWEIRPIVDKKLDRWYLAFNPAFERTLRGPGTGQGVTFSPALKVSYDVTRVVAAGFEYYGSLGPVTGLLPGRAQENQLVPAVDLNLGPDWEFNAGVAFGLTPATDHLLVKVILGRHFGDRGSHGWW